MELKEMRPMLASAVDDIKSLTYPVVCSPKLDGIRCLKLGGHALARSLKPIKNDHVRKTIEQFCPDGLDGELMAGDTFQGCTSAVMSEDGEPDFTWWVFDVMSGAPYERRLMALNVAVKSIKGGFVKLVTTKKINNAEELLAYEAECLATGFEGVMIRDPSGPYKHGRSTAKEGWLLKLKRFVDAEAAIVDFVELETNENEKKTNELGLSHRSTAKAGKVGKGSLGAFVVVDIKTSIKFKIGTGQGLTQKMRKEIWESRESHVGKIVKYRYQAIGVKEAPRCPFFLGFRDESDL